MTIATRQRRDLLKIECMFHRTDPRLAAESGILSRLTSGEEMPWTEHVTSLTPRRREPFCYRIMAVFACPVPGDHANDPSH
jgi:hypothetical protein